MFTQNTQYALPLGSHLETIEYTGVVSNSEPVTPRAELVNLGIKSLIAELKNGRHYTQDVIAKVRSLQGNDTQERITEFMETYRDFAAYRLEQIRSRSLRAGGLILGIIDDEAQQLSLVEIDYCEYDVHDGGQLIGMPGAIPFELDDVIDIRAWDAPFIPQASLPLDQDATFYDNYYSSVTTTD